MPSQTRQSVAHRSASFQGSNEETTTQEPASRGVFRLLRDRLAEKGHVPGYPLSPGAFSLLLHYLSQTPGSDGKYRKARADAIDPRPGEVIPLDPAHTPRRAPSDAPCACLTCKTKRRIANRKKQLVKRKDEELRGERVTKKGTLLNKGRPALVHFELHLAKHELTWSNGRTIKPHNQLLKVTPNVAELARRLGMSLEEESDGARDEMARPAPPSGVRVEAEPDRPYPSTGTKKYPSLRTSPAFKNLLPLPPPPLREAAPELAPAALEDDPPLPPVGGEEPSEHEASPMRARSQDAARDAAPTAPEKTREADKGTRANDVPLLSPVLAAWLALGLPPVGRGRAPIVLANRYDELRRQGFDSADAVQALFDVVDACRAPRDFAYLSRKEAEAQGAAFAIAFANVNQVLARAADGARERTRRALELERRREHEAQERERDRAHRDAPRMTADEWAECQRYARELGVLDDDAPTPAPAITSRQWSREEMIAELEKVDRDDDGAAE